MFVAMRGMRGSFRPNNARPSAAPTDLPPIAIRSNTPLRDAWRVGCSARKVVVHSNGSLGFLEPAASEQTQAEPGAGLAGREWLLYRNAALADPAAPGAGLDGAPQHLVASGEGAAVRHRQPQPQQQPVASSRRRLRIIIVG